LQRELAKEFGFYPATTNPEDIERHRRLNAAADAASAHGYRYDPCDRCGQATRYKQFPLVCRCTTPDRCPHPPIYVQGDHCQRCGGDARVPRENMHRLAKYIEEIWADQEQKNAALRVPSGPPLRIADRYAAERKGGHRQ
jgi:rRNA maturation protein Nop10